MQKLFISLPGETDYKVYINEPSSDLDFAFHSFDCKTRMTTSIAQTDDESFEPYLKAENQKPFTTCQSEYLNLIEKTVNHIRSEQPGKIVISRAQEYSLKIDPVGVFKSLVEVYPTACVYLFTHPQAGTWMGATPELLLKSEGDYIKSMSLAGTRKKGEESGFTAKEVEEQQLVTEYIHSLFLDNPYLTNITKKAPELHEAGNLEHFKTEISAQFQTGFQVLPFVNQLHPTPAVGGFPREEALEFIQKNEGYNREFYAGYFGLKGQGDFKFFVNLRCMQVFENGVVLYAGGGITKDSDPKAEWEETEAKMQTLPKVLKD